MQNVIAEGGKVLWIAHRTELLNQAFLAFRHSADSDALGDRESLRCHLISGEHDPGFKIQPDDDVVIASIHSVRPGAVSDDHLVNNWLSKQAGVFLVIDEAHHGDLARVDTPQTYISANCCALLVVGVADHGLGWY
jgi:superfamily II DNA or RNA helicase